MGDDPVAYDCAYCDHEFERVPAAHGPPPCPRCGSRATAPVAFDPY